MHPSQPATETRWPQRDHSQTIEAPLALKATSAPLTLYGKSSSLEDRSAPGGNWKCLTWGWAGSKTLPQDWTDRGTHCPSHVPQWEGCLTIMSRPLSLSSPRPHEPRLGTGEKGEQLKQASKWACGQDAKHYWISTQSGYHGDSSGADERKTGQGQLQEAGPSLGAKHNPTQPPSPPTPTH